MSNYAYIFVSRNMGNDYEYAGPPLGMIRGWLWRNLIKPEVTQKLKKKEQELEEAEPGCYKEALAKGISLLFYSHRHTVYSVKIAPDTLCPDPRAEGRSPYFIMHLLMPGTPELISRRFNEFCAKCQEIAWNTMLPGVWKELKVEIPDELYL